MNQQEITGNLNSEQREAVLATEGPVLILAGAGSGKTRVLVHRIAYLIDVLGVSPGEILAITFTNKAADEMRSRVDRMIGFGADQILVSTFHSFCVRILRRNAELLGYSRYFSIYDGDDQLTLMKQIFKQQNTDSRMMKEKSVLAAISSAKDELVDPARFREINTDYYSTKVGTLYGIYQDRLRENNAMDFDDLIFRTVELFEKHPEVLDACQDRFRYLMIDEYQDTNTAQFRLVSLLASKYRNLCVVGDDDQSIYKFRGANIRNILGFEKVFPDAKVVRLEQNYRSTQNILNAANEVIRHNHGRKDKRLWTENEAGTRVALRRFEDGFREAEYVAAEIRKDVEERRFDYQDCAVLYRTNAQSRLFEEKFLMANIPYRIIGGINFYARKEIKDLIAYLKTVDNGNDDLAVQRIINVPKRGIGGTTVAKLSAYAEAGGISFFDSICEAREVMGLSSAAVKKLAGFAALIAGLRVKAESTGPAELLRNVIRDTGYEDELKAENTDEAEARLENIDELVSKAVQYEENAEEPTLSGFLEEVALIADIDSLDDSENRVLLMTLHSAKGLEFPCVYMAGMEEGLFPSRLSLDADDAEGEIEEERRLAYVGITRAKKKLTLLSARSRMLRGEMVSNTLSRFVREIPRELIDLGDEGGRGRTPVLRGKVGRDLRDAILKPYDSGEKFGIPAPSGSGTGGRLLSGTSGRGTGAAAASAGPASVDYSAGDRVRHVKFGEGTVLSMEDGGRDILVTVDFPAWGVKKFYAGFARLVKVD